VAPVDSADGFGFTGYPSQLPDSHRGISFPEFDFQAAAGTHATIAQGIATYTAALPETGLDAIAGSSLDFGLNNYTLDPSDTEKYYNTQMGGHGASSEP
jgi:hypothetical protein